MKKTLPLKILSQNEIDARSTKLKEATMPLIKLLSEEYHPHHTAIVTATSIELMEGVCYIPKIYDYIGD